MLKAESGIMVAGGATRRHKSRDNNRALKNALLRIFHGVVQSASVTALYI